MKIELPNMDLCRAQGWITPPPPKKPRYQTKYAELAGLASGSREYRRIWLRLYRARKAGGRKRS